MMDNRSFLPFGKGDGLHHNLLHHTCKCITTSKHQKLDANHIYVITGSAKKVHWTGFNGLPQVSESIMSLFCSIL